MENLHHEENYKNVCLALPCLALTVLTAQAQEPTQERGETTINLSMNQTGINFLSDDAMQNIEGGYFSEIHINGVKQVINMRGINNAMSSAERKILSDQTSELALAEAKKQVRLLIGEKHDELQSQLEISAIRDGTELKLRQLATAEHSSKAYKLVVGGGAKRDQNYFVRVNGLGNVIKGTRVNF